MAFNYRITERTKQHFIDFFQKLFSMYTEGKIQFSDSYKKITFSKPPKCQSIDTYDFKYFPIILIGVSGVSSRDCGINKFKGYYTNELGIVDSVYGGFASANLNFQIRARSGDERNNLADLVLMYLDSVETKRTFERDFGIRIIGAPSIGGESAEDDPQTNVRQFIINVTQQFESDFEEGIDVIDTLGNTGLTVGDIIAYIPIVHCKVTAAGSMTSFTGDAIGEDSLVLVDGYYTDFTVRFTSGTLENVSRKIVGYIANTKMFTIESVDTTITENITFEIRGSS